MNGSSFAGGGLFGLGEIIMTKKHKDIVGRRSVLTGMGVAAAGVVAASGCAKAQEEGFRAARHEEDKWMGELSGSHRAWIDTSSGLSGMQAPHFARNILSSNVSAYGGKDSDYAIVICFRSYATPLAYSDEMWSKYGEYFGGPMQLTDPKTGNAFRANPANMADRVDLDHGGDTVEKVTARGAQFAICNAATTWYSGYIAGAMGGSAEEIYKEFVDSAIPNSRFVAAGVMATTRAQEYGYSLLYAG